MQLLPDANAFGRVIGEGRLSCKSLRSALLLLIVLACETRAMLGDRLDEVRPHPEWPTGTLGFESHEFLLRTVTTPYTTTGEIAARNGCSARDVIPAGEREF